MKMKHENKDIKKKKKKKSKYKDRAVNMKKSKNKEDNIRKKKSTKKNTNNIELESKDEGFKNIENVFEKNISDQRTDCSEATYLAQQMAIKEKPSLPELNKLSMLHIQLRHTVPLQHEIETRAGSTMPTREQIKLFENIIPLKKGLYTNAEDDIIVANWKAFCNLHGWDVTRMKPFLQLRVGSKTYMRCAKERRKFVQFLADGLPNRTLYSVYHRFRTLYENNVQGRYKPDEDQLIRDHLENNPHLDEKRKFSDLAKVLRRTRNSIWRHYRTLQKKNKKD